MATFKKIIPYALLSFLSVSPAFVYGKDLKKKAPKKPTGITLGLYASKEIELSPISFKLQNKSARRKGLFVAKTINTHFKFETGLAYTTYQTTVNGGSASHYFEEHLDKFSIPVSIQYHFATKCKLHPYCGAGLQYYITTGSAEKIHTDVLNKQRELPQNYLGVLFTQGLIYDVNPKLQVQQSFHFTADDNSRVFGIDLGVGYTIR